MKITRNMLLIVTAGLGIFLIVYSLIRHFTGLHFSDAFEKILVDTIIFVALGLFLYNRKLASDEKKAREAKEKAKLEAAARAEETDEDDESTESEPTGEPVEAEQTDAETPDTEDDNPCPEKSE
jgi:predicted  nucleic acid-binding Zn-ribbon protein